MGTEGTVPIWYKHFADRKIALTRSHPYQKNNKAHVEQRNYSHAQHLLGYRRLDNQQIVERLAEIMRDYSRLKNLFYPSRKLISKVTIGSNPRKLFDTPKTPYQRVLEHPLVADHHKARLRNSYISINPVLLKQQIFSKLRLLFGYASVTSQFEASNSSFGNNLI